VASDDSVSWQPWSQLPKLADEPQGTVMFKSTRRVLRMLDLISQQEGLTAKRLAKEMGTSLSTCYHLINVLVEEGYLEKIAHGGGYKLGPVIPLLYGRISRNSFDSKVEPVVEELAQRTNRHTYVGLLADREVSVQQVKVPPKSPPVGIVKGFHGASHALALGKVLISNTGAEGVKDYVDNYGLEAFTPQTITQPSQLERDLDKVRVLGYATDIEEFAANLRCVAAPIRGRGGAVEGTVGISTPAARFRGEASSLLELVRWAAKEAATLLEEDSERVYLPGDFEGTRTPDAGARERAPAGSLLGRRVLSSPR
jgi:IclR family acetate operon transcriptional repressor